MSRETNEEENREFTIKKKKKKTEINMCEKYVISLQ